MGLAGARECACVWRWAPTSAVLLCDDELLFAHLLFNFCVPHVSGITRFLFSDLFRLARSSQDPPVVSQGAGCHVFRGEQCPLRARPASPFPAAPGPGASAFPTPRPPRVKRRWTYITVDTAPALIRYCLRGVVAPRTIKQCVFPSH